MQKLQESRIESKRTVLLSTVISGVMVTLAVISGFFYSSNIIGGILMALSLFFVSTPEMLLPVTFVSTYLNENCFIFGNITTSRFFTLEMIFFILLSLKVNVNYNKKLLGLYVALAIYFVFSAFISIRGFSSAAITMEINIIFAIFLSQVDFKKIEKVLWIFVLGNIEILCGILYNLRNNSYGVLASGAHVLIENTNNNEASMAVAQISAFFAALFIFELLRSRRVKVMIGCIFVYFTCLFSIIMLGSRGSLTAALAAMVIAVFIYLVYSHANLKSFLLFALVVILLYFGVNYILSNNSEMAQRFSMDAIESTGGTGRFKTWEVAWNDIILKHPILGLGFDGSSIADELKFYGGTGGTHNMVLDIMAQTGIVGLILFVSIITSVLVSLFKCFNYNKNRLSLICILMIFAALVNGISENIYSSRFLWLVFGMSGSIILWCELEKSALNNNSNTLNPEGNVLVNR